MNPTPTDPREENQFTILSVEGGCADSFDYVSVEDARRLAAEIAELKREVERLNQESVELVDQFVSKLFDELGRLGIDTGSCDGENEPHIVIASWIVGKIDTLRAELEAKRMEVARFKRRVKGELTEDCPFCNDYHPTGQAQESPQCPLCFNDEKRDRLTTELEAARKELQNKEADRQYHMNHINRLAKAVGALGETSEAVIDTALAAKDAAKKRVAELAPLTSNEAKSLIECLYNSMSPAMRLIIPQGWNVIVEKLEQIRDAALTPAPTQEPPAGGASISTEKKGGDEPCRTIHSAATFAPDTDGVAEGHHVPNVRSNSPADVQPEGRGEWMPIATALDDGAEIILGWKKLVCSGHWDEKLNAWVTSHGTYRGSFNPTHWQPLPPPPMLPTEGSGA